jgi:hypothetical protein
MSRHFAAAQASGKDESLDRRPFAQVRAHIARYREGGRQRRTPPPPLIGQNPAFPVLNRLAAQTRYARERPRGDRRLEIGERGDAVIGEERCRRLGADAADAQHLQERRRKALVQLVEQLRASGSYELLDHRADRLSDAGQLEVFAGRDEIGERRRVFHRRRRLLVRRVLVERFSRHLHQQTNLEQLLRDLAVAKHQ